jgi:hypothetical protein
LNTLKAKRRGGKPFFSARAEISHILPYSLLTAGKGETSDREGEACRNCKKKNYLHVVIRYINGTFTRKKRKLSLWKPALGLKKVRRPV